MALIKCPECGREISDKAVSCPGCGFPLELLNQSSKNKIPSIKKQEVIKENNYTLELIDYTNQKIQIAKALKRFLNMKDGEALELVSQTPCFLFEDAEQQKINPLLEKLDSLPIEYKLYCNGEIKKHKVKTEINKPEISVPTYSTQTNTQTNGFKCPKCGSVIPISSRSCKYCGFEGISKYLLSLERDKFQKEREFEKQVRLEQERIRAEKNQISTESKQPKCPKCGCTNIQIVRRNWSFFGGFATNKTDRVCAKCNYKW